MVETFETGVFYDNAYMGEMVQEDMFIEEPKTTTNNVSLWVTIVVCAIVGVALGIILGRRSAMK